MLENHAIVATDALLNARHARILVVDDEPANLKLFGLMLRSEGYEQIVCIQDPREVVTSYRAARPDLVLLDINMPHLDGYAVMEALRAIADPLPAPIVVLTAQSGEEVLLRALDGGAVDFLCKPIGRRELLARVRNILMAHLAQRAVHDQNALLEQVVAKRTQQLRQSRLDLVRRLGRASELRDNETGQHILRMSHAAALLAKAAGWNAHACELLLNAAPMHDLGKIGIPDGILLKPGALTADELEVMQRHAEIGADILSGSDDELISMARDIAFCHHEKWDGTGYPRRLRGPQIPESARIVAITDVFDALTSVRPYKKAWSVEDALAYMTANAGKQFDPRLIASFVALVPEVQALRARFAEPPFDPAGAAENSR